MGVIVIDAGKPGAAGKRFRWVLDRTAGQGGARHDIARCAGTPATLRRRDPPAPGLRAPLCVPVRIAPESLTEAPRGAIRDGMRRRLARTAGIPSLSAGLVVAIESLWNPRTKGRNPAPTLNGRLSPSSPESLLLFGACPNAVKRRPDARKDQATILALTESQKGNRVEVSSILNRRTRRWV